MPPQRKQLRQLKKPKQDEKLMKEGTLVKWCSSHGSERSFAISAVIMGSCASELKASYSMSRTTLAVESTAAAPSLPRSLDGIFKSSATASIVLLVRVTSSSLPVISIAKFFFFLLNVFWTLHERLTLDSTQTLTPPPSVSSRSIFNK